MAAGSLQSALVVSHCNYHLLFKDESMVFSKWFSVLAGQPSIRHHGSADSLQSML